MCEHHLVPFTGVAHVGYIPAESGKITGLSKLARLVDVYAKRPQVQERLTTQIADSLVELLEARGVIVVIEAEPAHRRQDLLDRRFARSRDVGVLDAQDEVAAVVARDLHEMGFALVATRGTAAAIAGELGIEGRAVTGTEFAAMSKASDEKPQMPAPKLTDREMEVLRLVAQGLNNRDIAGKLFISENTVKNHIRNILEKLHLHSRMEAVVYAVREKMIEIT